MPAYTPYIPSPPPRPTPPRRVSSVPNPYGGTMPGSYQDELIGQGDHGARYLPATDPDYALPPSPYGGTMPGSYGGPAAPVGPPPTANDPLAGLSREQQVARGAGRTPEELEARLAQLEAEAMADYDRSNPGAREYRAEVDRRGRPLYNSELGQLPSRVAGNATTTLGGNWGNAFGELENDEFLETMRGTNGARPVQVMQAGGGTKTIYRQPGGSGAAAPEPQAIPVPEGGYNSDREKAILARLDEEGGGMTNRERQAALYKTTARVNPIDTYQYDSQGDYVRDWRGNPVKNPEVAAQRDQYLAEQKAQEQEGRDVSRRNYQLKQAGLRSVPIPDHVLERLDAENERIRNGGRDFDPLGREKLRLTEEEMKLRAAQEEAKLKIAQQEGAANRQTDLEKARIEAEGRRQPQESLDQKTRAGIAIGAVERGEMTPEEADRYVSGGAAATPGPTAEPAGARPIPPWARNPQTRQPLTPEEIVRNGRAQGIPDEQINEILKQSTGNSYADIADPDGLTARDWFWSLFPPTIPVYIAGQAAQGERPRHPIGRVLGVQ